MYHFTLLLNLQLLQSDPWYCTIVRPYVISRFSPPPMVRWGTNLVKYKIIHNNQFYGTMLEWYLYHVGTVPGQHCHHPLPSYNHVLQQPDHSRLGMLWWGTPYIWQWGPFSRYLMGIWGSLLLGFPHKLKGTRTTYPSEVWIFLSTKWVCLTQPIVSAFERQLLQLWYRCVWLRSDDKLKLATDSSRPISSEDEGSGHWLTYVKRLYVVASDA